MEALKAAAQQRMAARRLEPGLRLEVGGQAAGPPRAHPND
jgi:hypothetical protein